MDRKIREEEVTQIIECARQFKGYGGSPAFSNKLFRRFDSLHPGFVARNYPLISGFLKAAAIILILLLNITAALVIHNNQTDQEISSLTNLASEYQITTSSSDYINLTW